MRSLMNDCRPLQAPISVPIAPPGPIGSRREGGFELCMRDAQQGSDAALGDLLDGCRQYLLLAAGQALPTELQAKVGASDLVQETFVEAHRDFPQFRGRSQAELLAWLRQILLNNIRDLQKHFGQAAKRQIHREVPLEDRGDSRRSTRPNLPCDTETPSWLALLREEHESVREALQKLAPDHQQVIRLRNMELQSFEEIGHVMERSPDAARKLWGRAIVALGELLETGDEFDRA